MTLTHSTRSHAGDGCEVVAGGGLTGFGREVVAAMNQRGMLIDVSHLNDAGFRDVLDRIERSGDRLPQLLPQSLPAPAQPHRRPAPRPR